MAALYNNHQKVKVNVLYRMRNLRKAYEVVQLVEIGGSKYASVKEIETSMYALVKEAIIVSKIAFGLFFANSFLDKCWLIVNWTLLN